MTHPCEEQAHMQAPAASLRAGRYVYCVARARAGAALDAEGIGGARVYAVAHGDLCALVHDCPAHPYQSDDPEVAAAWVLAHHRVVEAAWKRWGTVLPLTFNTIVAPGEGTAADENLAAWLRTDYVALRGRLDSLAGKAEYGVQVFWDPLAVARKVAAASPEIRRLEEESRARPRGLAYMYRQKLDALLKKEVRAAAEREFKDLYDRLSRCADSIHIEKAREGQGPLQMLMNLSCLASGEQLPGLKAELDRIDDTEGYAVRLVGPLPPYSFC